MLPEVVLFSKTENTLCRNSDLFIPDIKGLVIVKIDGRIQTVRVKAYHLGQKFPGPADRLLLKIISKGEIAQHLKKCAVAGSLAYIFNITGTDTFLTGGHPFSGRHLSACKVWLQRRHTGIDQQ